MAKNERRSATGPPPKVKKWLDEYRRGKHQGRIPSPEHFKSIWDTTRIPEDCTPATSDSITDAESRLGIVIPASMKQQLLIQNGGSLADCPEYPFDDSSINWTNATVDGIEPVESWERAKNDHWFDNVNDVTSLDLLIRIAAHSEAQLCLDYRKAGSNGLPGVTFIDVSTKPTEVRIITERVDEFIRALVASRSVSDNP